MALNFHAYIHTNFAVFFLKSLMFVRYENIYHSLYYNLKKNPNNYVTTHSDIIFVFYSQSIMNLICIMNTTIINLYN